MSILFDRGDGVKVQEALRKKTGVVLNYVWHNPKELEKEQNGSGWFIPLATAAGGEVAKKGGQWVGKKIFGGSQRPMKKPARKKISIDNSYRVNGNKHGGINYETLTPITGTNYKSLYPISGGSAVLQGAPNVQHRRKKLKSLPVANNYQLDRMVLSYLKSNNFDPRLYRGAQPDDKLTIKGLILPAIGIVNNEGSGEEDLIGLHIIYPMIEY